MILLETSAPAAIKSMTVQEVLDTIETLEKTQEERDKVIGIIEAQEKNALKMKQKVNKTIKGMPESDQKRGNDKYDRLSALGVDSEGFIEKMKDLKKDLMDPNVEGGFAAKILLALKVAKEWSKVVNQHKRAIASDVQIGDWEDVFDAAEDFIDKFSFLPGAETLKGAVGEISGWLSKAGKAFSWMVNKVKGDEEPAAMLDDLVDDIALQPDSKTKTAPFMNLFNIDDEYQAMLDDNLEVQFIKDFKTTLKDFPLKNMTMGELENMSPDSEWNIDNALEKWIPQQSDTAGHSVEDLGA